MLTALAQCSADEFDIEAAIYWFTSDWHGGQMSAKCQKRKSAS
jgi:hypothetical protein